MDNNSVLDNLRAAFGESISLIGEPHGLLTVETGAASIIALLTHLKEDRALGFNYLTDITAVHYPLQVGREYGVVYHLHNMYENLRIRVKVFLDKDHIHIPTATVLWNGANWMERETYDFYGVVFDGHPDLRRILNMDDLDVFPMRKEYPLEDPNRVDKKDFYFGR